METDTHPSFATIRAGRPTSHSGASLFDSEIRHQHYVTVSICRAKRNRELNRDWIHSGEELIEVSMSMAQWGAFVSSFGSEGVPCTISRFDHELVENPPYAPRLTNSIAEVNEATQSSVESIRSAFKRVEEARAAGGKKNLDEAMRSLELAISNAPLNMEFAATSLTKHVENVVTKARADIEAMVQSSIETLGAKREDLAIEVGL